MVVFQSENLMMTCMLLLCYLQCTCSGVPWSISRTATGDAWGDALTCRGRLVDVLAVSASLGWFSPSLSSDGWLDVATVSASVCGCSLLLSSDGVLDVHVQQTKWLQPMCYGLNRPRNKVTHLLLTKVSFHAHGHIHLTEFSGTQFLTCIHAKCEQDTSHSPNY